MSADLKLTRRAALGGLALLSLKGRRALAQGFAGLAESAQGYAQVTPGKHFSFPADHGPHSDYRIEWWYVTANLIDAHGTAYGSQWTLFRQALSSRGLSPGGDNEGWADQQIWMAHAALTRADTHRTSETFARGGVGQAGVEADPFRAWIDAWTMRSASGMNATTIAPLDLIAAGTDFSYALHLEANRPLVLQGDGGYSRKSERDQASYYYSQPFFAVTGRIDFDGGPVEVTGHAWMDREWSSQPLAADQTGWDWFALHFESGEKLMLYRMREKGGKDYLSGNWIMPDGSARQLAAADIGAQPKAPIEIDGHKLPVEWHIVIPSLALAIDCVPLNPKAWMATSFPYWEGPISFQGTHRGVGYLELTGY
jgi:predicted secreted hydrolase